MDVLIVGASIAGVATADALRAEGVDGCITLVDADPNLPYDKPPLSKLALGADWRAERGLLRPEQHYADKRIALVLGRRAVSLDCAQLSITLDDGQELSADSIVLAPGVRARELPPQSMLPGVFSIRTSDDSTALRLALSSRPRLVVVGGGFIGAEAASMAATLGADVTVVEVQALPFAHLFGPEVAAALARRHAEHGVRLVSGVGVDHIEGDGRVERVVLSDGQELPADVVVLGLGAIPAVDWLMGAGVLIDDGIVCDQYGRTTVAGVYAAGDAAAWWDDSTGRHRRIEHWTTAKEQGAAVAHNIAHPEATPKSAGPVPYFWSDQYGRRLQFLGTSAGFDSAHVVHGSLADEEFVVLFGREGKLIGALGLAAARHLMRHRVAIAEGASVFWVLESEGAAEGVAP